MLHPEVKRVLALPERYYDGEDLTQQLKTPQGTETLWPVQSSALLAIRDCRGALLPIGVGHGKTKILFLAATVLGCSKPVMLVPAHVVGQVYAMLHADLEHWRIVVPTILSYGELQTPRGFDLLEDSGLDLLLCDEAHYLRHLTSARTKRVVRLLESRRVSVVMASGTITGTSLHDYAHLAAYALRENSPLPHDRSTLEAWANVIDAHGEPKLGDLPRAAPLSGGVLDRGVIRDGFRKRLRSAPGVVVTDDPSASCTLTVRAETTHSTLSSVTRALQTLRQDGIRPDGEVLADPLAEWRCARTLSLGFYYRWVWPNGVVDQEWLERRAAWRRAVRLELEAHSRHGYDSAFLVEAEVSRGRGSNRLTQTYRDWKEVSDRPEPGHEVVWLDKGAVERFVAKAPKPGLIWYESKAVESRLSEIGYTVHGAGAKPPTDPSKLVALSWRVFSEGCNLQAWSANYVLEPPGRASTWEQLLGRTHRAGQEADEVFCTTLQHTAELRQRWNKVTTEARYIERTTGVRQKLLFAQQVRE